MRIKNSPCTFVIRMQDPLKQGLKLNYLWRKTVLQCVIRMQDPLKQGLKLL